MSPSAFEYVTCNPARALDWRWQHAQEIVAGKRRSSCRRRDAETIVAVDYLRALAEHEEEVEREERDRRAGKPSPLAAALEVPGKDGPPHWAAESRLLAGRTREEAEQAKVTEPWPSLADAHRLAGSDGFLRWEVEARILARQSDPEIAQACGLAIDTVRWFEALFFHVRDRLDACDWICRIIRQRGELTRDNLRGIWWHFGYDGGAPALEAFMAVTLHRSLPGWLRATFTKDPLLQERRFRVVVELAIAAMTATSDDELKQLRRLHKELRQLDTRLGIALDPLEEEKLKLLMRNIAMGNPRPGPRARSTRKGSRQRPAKDSAATAASTSEASPSQPPASSAAAPEQVHSPA